MLYRCFRSSCLTVALVIGVIGWACVSSTGEVCVADEPPGTEVSPGYRMHSDILYRSQQVLPSDALIESQCRLDVYYPTDGKPFSTVVWFHGGGLTGGKRSVPERLQRQGVAVVAVSYRLYPSVSTSACIQDAAAAVAWSFRQIGNYGGSADRIFVSGHSAGGYLTNMIGLDKRWLQAEGIDADQIAGLIPFSGHSITHMTVRKERGIPDSQPIVDEMAPLFHVRKDAPPMLLISGDRELEMLGRYEESAYFWRMLQNAGHPDVALLELDGYNHSQMADPGFPLLLRFMHRVANAK